MVKLISILFFISPWFINAQGKDSIDYDLNLIGDWIFDYYLITELDGTFKDSFVVKNEVLRMNTGLRIGPGAVDEFFDFWDLPEDSTQFMGVGPWHIEQVGNITKIDFDCAGIVLCGAYELIAVKENKLILRHCSNHEDEDCEVLHLKRRIE